MSVFTLPRAAPAAPGALWASVTDFAAYGRWMPLTTMRVDPGEPRVGWGFAGASGLGPLRFVDSMLLTVWEPPMDLGSAGRFRVVKTGRLLAGWADVRVLPEPGGARVEWAEEIVLRPLVVGRRAQALTDRLGTVLFGRALDGMVAAAEQRG